MCIDPNTIGPYIVGCGKNYSYIVWQLLILHCPVLSVRGICWKTQYNVNKYLYGIHVY